MTISKNIAAVPPAHYLLNIAGKDTYSTKVYFQFEFPCDKSQNTEKDFDAIIKPSEHKLRNSAQFLRQQKSAILISGGIDSSLYASYLNEFDGDRIHGVNCTFGDNDPEFKFAQMLAEKVNAHFCVGRMMRADALDILNDIVALTGHPFGDFSTLSMVFILKYMKEYVKEVHMLIEGNGADDCFGFPALGTKSRTLIKGWFPKVYKDTIVSIFKKSKSWKWESKEGFLTRVLSLSDDHETNFLNYFLVYAPVNFLRLQTYGSWDRQLTEIMDGLFSSYEKEHGASSFEAKLTIRKLMHINSRRCVAKAYSVGESLGIRIIYLYIW
jgi:hypothetical protein